MAYDNQFAAALKYVIYYSATNEWPIGHTLLEVKEKCKAKLKAQEELKGATSNNGSDNDNDNKDKGGNNINAKVDWLLILLLSAKSPLAILYRRKRRRISGEDEEEKKRLIKKHKGRKWRWTLNIGDKEEGDKKRPSKVYGVFITNIKEILKGITPTIRTKYFRVASASKVTECLYKKVRRDFFKGYYT
ncbi:hypothetical protein V2W45_1466197 [Cenococcum geophilum]